MLPRRRIGDRLVGAIGFGTAAMSVRAEPDDAAGLEALLAALGAGVTLFDTADVYNPPGQGAGHAERLLGEALRRADRTASEVVIASKGGKHWIPGGDVAVDGRPESVRRACVDSLRRLGLDQLPLYFLHTRDPQVPYAESVGALAELRREGLIEQAGVSNVSVELLEVARSIVPVAAVENRYAPERREHDPVIDCCEALGIAFLPWGSFKGLHDPACGHPSLRRCRELAAERAISPEQVVLAWSLARSPVVVPIPGASRPATILDCLDAAHLELAGEDLDSIDAAGEPGDGRRGATAAT